MKKSPTGDRKILMLTSPGTLSRFCENLAEELEWLPEILSNSNSVLARLANNEYHFLLLSEKLIDNQLDDWLDHHGRRQPVIILGNNHEPAVLMRRIHQGISELLPDSTNTDRLKSAILNAIRINLPKSQTSQKKKIRDNHIYFGKAPSIEKLLAQIEKISTASTPILLEGETGTGKSFFARRIHQLSGRKGKLVSINCSTFSTNLLESELFGHTKGAYTGAESARPGLVAAAANGTLFLDEIGELPLELQPKLLHLLEERMIRSVGADTEQPVSARIIAATNCNLKQQIKEGRFRSDLFYRLNVISLKLPSLKSRADDIPDLAAHFIDELCEEHQLQPADLSRRNLNVLKKSSWPGNVRQLRNHLERALLLDLPFEHNLPEAEIDHQQIPNETEQWLRLDEVEKQHIFKALEKSGDNKSQAALLLGISRRTLERKLKKWDSEVA